MSRRVMTIKITVLGTCKLQFKKTKLITEEHLLFGQEKKIETDF